MSIKSLKGQIKWLDEARAYLCSNKSQAENIACRLGDLIYSDSLMANLKKAKKEGNDDDVYTFFNNAAMLNNRLGCFDVAEEYSEDIADGIDIMAYSYENDSLILLQKDNSLFLSDFLTTDDDSLEEDLNEAFSTTPTPVVNLEVQFNAGISEDEQLEAFKKFLSMAEKVSAKYKDKFK